MTIVLAIASLLSRSTLVSLSDKIISVTSQSDRGWARLSALFCRKSSHRAHTGRRRRRHRLIVGEYRRNSRPRRHNDWPPERKIAPTLRLITVLPKKHEDGDVLCLCQGQILLLLCIGCVRKSPFLAVSSDIAISCSQQPDLALELRCFTCARQVFQCCDVGFPVIVSRIIKFEIGICQLQEFNPFSHVDQERRLRRTDEIFNAHVQSLQVFGSTRFGDCLKTRKDQAPPRSYADNIREQELIRRTGDQSIGCVLLDEVDATIMRAGFKSFSERSIEFVDSL